MIKIILDWNFKIQETQITRRFSATDCSGRMEFGDLRKRIVARNYQPVSKGIPQGSLP
jgi:hypothetical protein